MAHIGTYRGMENDVSVKKMTLQPWASIAALRTFKDCLEDEGDFGVREIRTL